MQRKTQFILDLDFQELERTRNNPRHSMIMRTSDIGSPVSKKKIQKSPTGILEKPKMPDSNSVLSVKVIENCPLTEVSSWTPTEILPSQCVHSENPSVNYFFERAFESSKNQEYQTAIKLYKKVIACDPNHFESWINIGICMMNQNMHTEAISSFDNAIKADKTSFIPYYNKALNFILVHDFISALQCMDMASMAFTEPPPELQKIRTYSIFKSGKVSSAIKNVESSETPMPSPRHAKATSPVISIVHERKNFEPRRMTMPVQYNREVKNFLPSMHHAMKIQSVEEVDTRNIKTALTVPKSRGKEDASQSMSPLRATEKKRQNKKGLYNWKRFQHQEFFQPHRKLEIPISEMEVKDNKIRDLMLEKKIREKLNTMDDKLLQYVVKSIQKNFTKPEYANLSEFTEKEVKELDDLFNRNEKNLCEIDRILRHSVFFSQYSEEYRMKIYVNSELVRVEKGRRVFSQGNSAVSLFTILKGSVASVIDSEKAEENSTTEFLRYSRTLSPSGQNMSFDEYQANCTANETTYLLAICVKEYQVYLIELLKKEIEERLVFMITLPLFKGLDPLQLISLAWNIKKEVYHEGECVIAKHEVPKGLMIIYSGFCEICTTGQSTRGQQGSEYANIKKRTKRPASFYTGNLSIKSPNLKSIQLPPKNIEKIEHGLLQFGDFFGSRVIMDQKNLETGSKFSIIADSKNVEILIISKSSLQFLQEKIVAHLKNVLQKTHDHDSPPEVNSNEMDKQFVQWQNYKSNVIDNIQRNKFVTSKKIEFPYLR